MWSKTEGKEIGEPEEAYLGAALYCCLRQRELLDGAVAMDSGKALLSDVLLRGEECRSRRKGTEDRRTHPRPV